MDAVQRLTAKEREVLELVHARLSSKEIGLQLGLSRKSVDQRLDNARAKLGAPTRIAAARIFAELTDIQERFPYAPFPLPESRLAAPDGLRVSTDATYTLSDSMTFSHELPWHRPLSSDAPEFWALRLGALPRLVLILLGAVGLLVIALLGLSLSQGASALFRG
ncbi:MAG: helix-turn-helix transcriptional regulator [Novosphingobium sp.]